MKLFKKSLLAVAALFAMAGTLSGCHPADVVEHNIQVNADNFNVKRRMTFVNLRSASPTPLYSVEGYFSVQTTYENEYVGQQELGVLIEVGHDEYMLHYFGLGNGVTYIIEQLVPTDGDKYHYTILWYVPFPDIEGA